MHFKINITPLDHSTIQPFIQKKHIIISYITLNIHFQIYQNLNLNSWWGKRKVKVYVCYLSTIYVLRPLIWGHCGHLKGLVIPNLAE